MRLIKILLFIFTTATVFSCGRSEEAKRQRLAELCDSIRYFYENDYNDKCVYYGREAVDLAIELNDSASLAFIENNIGRNLYAIENYDATCMHFDRAVKYAFYAREADQHLNLTLYLMDLAAYHAQILDLQASIKEYEDALAHYVAARNLDPKIASAQVLDSINGKIHISLARIYQRNKESAKAIQYYEVFAYTKYADSYEGRRMYAYYLMLLKDYEQAAKILEKLQTEKKEDFATAASVSICDNLSLCYYRLGRYQDAYEEASEYESQRHARQKRLTNNQLVYQCNNIEKGLMKMESAREKEEAHDYLVALSIISFISIILLFIFIGVWRRLRHYKLVVYQQQNTITQVNIDEAYLTQKIQETISHMKTQNKLEKKEKDDIASQTAKEIKEEAYRKNAVEKFMNEVTSRKLYCNPNFKREDLVAELNLRKSTFAADFEAVTGEPVAMYIQRLRLEHAAELLKGSNNYTIDAIALESGFFSRSTFYRLFAEAYGQSPAEYRR